MNPGRVEVCVCALGRRIRHWGEGKGWFGECHVNNVNHAVPRDVREGPGPIEKDQQPIGVLLGVYCGACILAESAVPEAMVDV